MLVDLNTFWLLLFSVECLCVKMCSNVCSKSSIDAIRKRDFNLLSDDSTWAYTLYIVHTEPSIQSDNQPTNRTYTERTLAHLVSSWQFSWWTYIISNNPKSICIRFGCFCELKTLVFHVKLFQNNLFTYLVWVFVQSTRVSQQVCVFVCIFDANIAPRSSSWEKIYRKDQRTESKARWNDALQWDLAYSVAVSMM